MIDKTALSGDLTPTEIIELAEGQAPVHNPTGAQLFDFSKETEASRQEFEEGVIEFVTSKLRPFLEDNEANLRKTLQQGGITIRESSEVEDQLQKLQVINSSRTTQDSFITKFLFSLRGSKSKKDISSVIPGVIFRDDEFVPVLASPVIAANLIASDFGQFPISEDQIYLLKKEIKLKSQELASWPTSYNQNGVIAHYMAKNLWEASKRSSDGLLIMDMYGWMDSFINENVEKAIQRSFPGIRRGRIEKLLNASEIKRDEAAKSKARKDALDQYKNIMRTILNKFQQKSFGRRFSSEDIFNTLFIEYTPLLVRQTANLKAEESFTLYPILARDDNKDLIPEVIGYIPRQWCEILDEE